MIVQDDEKTTCGSDDQLASHEEYFFNEPMRYYPAVKCAMTVSYTTEKAKIIRDFPVYEDDIWVLTYPKCGTTWCQEMVWLIGNNLDYKGAEKYIFMRFPFLEYKMICAKHCKVPMPPNPYTISGAESPAYRDLGYAADIPRPRYLKSHLPLPFLPAQLLEKKPKIVHVIRDPKDTAVSYLHHYQFLRNYQGTPEAFFEAFLNGRSLGGNYWTYVESFWRLKDESNVLILQFEEMKKNLPATIKKTADFLGKELSEEEITRLAEHLGFSNMKTNRWVNFQWVTEQMASVLDKTAFMRKGEVGDYKNVMSPEMIQKFDEWNREMKLTLGIEDFPY